VFYGNALVLSVGKGEVVPELSEGVVGYLHAVFSRVTSPLQTEDSFFILYIFMGWKRGTQIFQKSGSHLKIVGDSVTRSKLCTEIISTVADSGLRIGCRGGHLGLRGMRGQGNGESYIMRS
jgi:hypothetical protein